MIFERFARVSSPPRHSRESGNPQVGEQPIRPKSSAERNRRIHSPFSAPSFPRKRESTSWRTTYPPEIKRRAQAAVPLSLLRPVIPAKAGIQRVEAKLAIQSQARIPAGGSPLPLRERARVRVSPRFRAALRAGRPRSQARAFVRIRILRISGIFRISPRPTCLFSITANPAKTNTDERPPLEKS